MRINSISDYIDSIRNEEAFRKIARLYNASSEAALESYIIDNYEEFVEFYKQVKYFEEHPEEFSITNYIDNGAIDLTKVPSITSRRNAYGSRANFSKNWIICPDLKTYLIKKNPRGSHFTKHPYYNILIASKIAKKMNVQCAQYYLARNGNNGNIENNITCNFLKEGETLISGEEIIFCLNFEKPSETLTYRLICIEKYLQYRKVKPEVIEKIKQDYIKLAFFNRFINNTDETDWNYAFIYDSSGKEIIGLAPGFDLDFSCDAYPDLGRALLLNDGTSEITSFIEQFKQERWFREFIQEFIDNFNIEEILQEVREEHGITFEEEELEDYTKFFKHRFFMIKRAAEMYFDSEEPIVREEIC